MALVPVNDIKQVLARELSPRRFHHTLCVARLAKKLARLHGVSEEAAFRAGLVHDCAKEWSGRKLFLYVKKHRLYAPDLEFIMKNAPNLLHAAVGAHVARARRWIDAAAARAVAAHTLGAFDMTPFDQIIYVADFASTDRSYPQAKKTRTLAAHHLKQAFAKAMRTKIKFSLKKFKPVHPLSVRVWNQLYGR